MDTGELTDGRRKKNNPGYSKTVSFLSDRIFNWNFSCGNKDKTMNYLLDFLSS